MIVCPDPPVINAPGHGNACYGTSISYSVTNYTGTILRWEYNTDGATWRTLAATSWNTITTSFSENTEVRVVFSASCGTYYSEPLMTTIVPAPSSPPMPTITEGCGIVTLTIASAPSGYTHYWQVSSYATSADRSELNYTVSANDTYYLRTRNNSSGCWSGATSVPVTLSNASASLSGPGSICSGDAFTLNIQPGYTGTILRWQSYSESTWHDIANTSATYSSNATVTTQYRAVLQAPCGEYHSTVHTLTVKPLPGTPSVNTYYGSRCGPGEVDLFVQGGSGNYYWYSTDTGGTPVAQRTNYYKTPALQTNATYYVNTQSNGCVSPRIAVPAVIKPLPLAPPLPVVTQNNCNGTATLTTTSPPSGSYYFWQTSNAGTSMSSSSLNYPVTTSGTYHLRSYQSSTYCWGPATSVDVTVPTAPLTPELPTITQECGYATLIPLPVTTGFTNYWQTSSTGTEQTNSSTLSVTSSGTFYLRVLDNASGCWSAARAVSVNVSGPVLPVISGPTIVCPVTLINLALSSGYSGSIVSWQSSYDNVNWHTYNYTSSTFAMGGLTSKTTFRVKLNDPATCGTYYSRPITIDVRTAPSAPPAPSVIQSCNNAILTVQAPPSGIAYYWQTSATGTDKSNGTGQYTVTASGSYYVRSHNAATGCWGSATAATVTTQLRITGTDRVCSGTAFTLALPSGYTGTIQRWESSTNGGQTWSNIENTTVTLNVNSISANTTYRVAIDHLSGVYYTCAYAVEVIAQPAMPLEPTYNQQCGSTVATITSPMPGATYYWKNQFTPEVTTSLTYTATNLTPIYLQMKSAENCMSAIRSITIPAVNMSTPPPMPALSSNGCGRVILTYQTYLPVWDYTFYWQTSPNGTSTAVSGGSWPGTYTINTPGTYYLRARSNGALKCWSPATAVVINHIEPGISAPTVTPVENCGPGSFTLYAYGCTDSYRWYSQPTGGTASGTSHFFLTPALNMTTTYYVCNVSATGLEGPRTPLTVTIKPKPAIPAPLQITQQCDGSTQLTINEQIPQDVTYYWQDENPNGQSTSNNSSTYTTTRILTLIYLRGRNNSTGCWGDSRGTPIEINYTPPTPAAPIAGVQNCRTVTVQPSDPLFTAFYSYYWQTSEIGTDTDKPAATLVTGTVPLGVRQSGTYYIRAKNSVGCWSPASSVSVSVLPTMCVEEQNLNYIITNDVKQEGILTETSVNGLLVEGNSQSITYFDGLSRPIQKVITQGSPTKLDIVQPFVYDVFGHEFKKYLPYTKAYDGLYKQNALIDQADFYRNHGAQGDRDTTSYPFAEIVYQASPLNKIKEYGSPGKDWRIGGGHTVKAKIRFNMNNEVRLWVYDFSTGQYTSPGYYAINELIVTEVIDENGHKQWVFTDKQDQTILTKEELSTDQIAYTYFVYDSFSRLRMVIQPEGFRELQEKNTWTLNSVFIDKWCFTYKYDRLGRVKEKKAPGSFSVYTVYNKRNLPVLTQDGNQRSHNKWNFVKYDGLSRVVMTGIYTHNSATSQDQMQQIADVHANQVEFRTNVNHQIQYGYTIDQSFPILTASNSVVLTVSYYDDYDYNNDGSPDRTYVPGMLSHESTVASQVVGKLTGSKVKVLDSNQMLQTALFYDKWDNVMQTQVDNQRGGEDITTSRYDFAGSLLESKLKHSTFSSEYNITKYYEYDHFARPRSIRHQVNNRPIVILFYQRYNELGQPVEKKLHSEDGFNYEQKIDYRYNIRGWLTKINDVALSETSDLFGMELRYNQVSLSGAGHTQFNGNIGEIVFNDKVVNQQRGYGFNYYFNGALYDARYAVKKTNGWDATNSGYYNEGGISYDLNGNIRRLDRYAAAQNSYGFAQIDNLTYSYEGNKLIAVEDLISGDAGFVNGVSEDIEYSYDANGNMVKDDNKGISEIKYNYNNLIQQVIKDNGQLEYQYDAVGTLLSKTVIDSDGIDKTRYYVGGFEYSNENQLEHFSHEEGRVVMTGSNPEYQYYMKDHLGNIRLTFTSMPQTDAAIATFETAKWAAEHEQFVGYDQAVKVNYSLFNHTSQGSTYYSARLNGTANERVGLGKTLSVMTGDTITMEVYAKYVDTNSNNWTAAFTNFITAIAAGTAPAGTIIEGQTTGNLDHTVFPYGALDKSNDTGTGPKAYLNYLVFDKNYSYKDGGFIRMTESARETGVDIEHERLFKELIITEPGFVYIYVSNEDEIPTDVYFDDFQVTHQMSSIVQSDSYYPFGERFESYSRENSLFNSKLFNNGSELQTDLGFNVYFTKYRTLDTQLGRWMQIDPLAHKFGSESMYNYGHNNPLSYNDPDGDAPNGEWQTTDKEDKSFLSHMGQAVVDELDKRQYQIMMFAWKARGKNKKEIKELLKDEIKSEPKRQLLRKALKEAKESGLLDGIQDYVIATFEELLAEKKEIAPITYLEPSVEHRTEGDWEKGVKDLNNALRAVNDGTQITAEELNNLDKAIKEMDVLQRWRSNELKEASKSITKLTMTSYGYMPSNDKHIKALQVEYEKSLKKLRNAEWSKSNAIQTRSKLKEKGY